MEQNADTGVPVAPMVENKQKSGNGLKIATVIACVVAVCGIGFGVFGMVQSSQKDEQISDLKIEMNDKNAKINELETKLSNLDSETEEAAVGTETITATDSDATNQVSGNNTETATVSLESILDKNDARTVFKIGGCTADGPSVKCSVIVNGEDALISYNSNDSILRLSLPND